MNGRTDSHLRRSGCGAPRVAFATPGVVPILRGNASVYGGSELRAWRFARGLADLGFPVCLIAPDAADVSGSVLGPVSLVADDRGPDRWRRLGRRLFGARDSGPAYLWRKAAADIYIAFGVAEYTAELASWCRARGHAMILMAGSDCDFSAEYVPGSAARNPYGSRCDLCHEAVMRADVVVVQTTTQHDMVRERFERDAILIGNPVRIAPRTAVHADEQRYFLWIGKSDRIKRPELVLDLARLCPDAQFRMIVNPVDPALHQQVRRDAPANLQILDRIEPAEVMREISGAIALLNTSLFEGFPNAMLEAGACGVPVLSLAVDPGGILAREGAGLVAHGDTETLARAVRRFDADRTLGRDAGARFLRYVRDRHEATARIKDLADVVMAVSAPGRGAARIIA